MQNTRGGYIAWCVLATDNGGAYVMGRHAIFRWKRLEKYDLSVIKFSDIADIVRVGDRKPTRQAVHDHMRRKGLRCYRMRGEQ